MRIWTARVLHVKVAALRLFHPTVSSVRFGPGFYYYDTVSQGRGGNRFIFQAIGLEQARRERGHYFKRGKSEVLRGKETRG